MPESEGVIRVLAQRWSIGREPLVSEFDAKPEMRVLRARFAAKLMMLIFPIRDTNQDWRTLRRPREQLEAVVDWAGA